MSIFDDQSQSLAKAFNEIMQVEANVEKKRRDLSMRTDFNLKDAFYLFNHSGNS